MTEQDFKQQEAHLVFLWKSGALNEGEYNEGLDKLHANKHKDTPVKIDKSLIGTMKIDTSKMTPEQMHQMWPSTKVHDYKPMMESITTTWHEPQVFDFDTGFWKPQPNLLPNEPNVDPSTIKTEALRYNQGKPDWSLFPFEAVEEIVKVLEFGAKKYAAWNHAKGIGLSWKDCGSSILRHMFAWMRGEDNDPESGLSHIAHAGCGIIFLLNYIKNKEKFTNDDRVKR